MKISFNSFNNYSVNLKSKPIKNINFKGVDSFDTFEKKEQTHIKNLSKNFDKPINVVFSDIDGTMVQNDLPFVHGRIYRSAVNLKENNIPLVLSTGRSLDEIFSITEQLYFYSKYFSKLLIIL